MKTLNRQTTILDEIVSTDWIDKDFYVYKTKQGNLWHEYSPKFLTHAEAYVWIKTNGKTLCEMFKRKLMLHTCKPSDNPDSWWLEWEQLEYNPRTRQMETTWHIKKVPGEDFEDAVENLLLFVPKARDVKSGFKINL